MAVERGRRLSPCDSNAFFNCISTAIAHFVARRFDEATEWADRALHDQPRLITAMRIKAAAFAHLGRLDEACAELDRILAIDPRLTIARYRVALGSTLQKCSNSWRRVFAAPASRKNERPAQVTPGAAINLHLFIIAEHRVSHLGVRVGDDCYRRVPSAPALRHGSAK